MSGIDEFFGDAVAEKGLSHAGISIEEKVVGLPVEIVQKIPAFRHQLLHGGQGCEAGGRIFDSVRVVAKGKMLKIFRFQNIPDIGLVYSRSMTAWRKQVHFSLPM